MPADTCKAGVVRRGRVLPGGLLGARLIGAAWLALAPAIARAQNPLARECERDTVVRLGAAAAGVTPLSLPASRIDRARDLMERDGWIAIVDSVAADFRASRAAIPAPAREAFGRSLDTLRATLVRVRATTGFRVDRRTVALVSPAMFKPERPDPDKWAYVLFRDTPQQIAIDSTMPREARRDLCWAAITLDRVLAAYADPAFQVAVDTLRLLDAQWTNFLARGYSQLPWELLANDRLFVHARDLAPPRWQLVFMHPSVAVEVEGSVWKELRRREVASLEPVGLLWYTRQRSFYIGVSAFASLPSNDNAGIGPGLHLGKHALLAYVFRARDAAGVSHNSTVASLDLYGLLTRVPDTLERLRDVATQKAGEKFDVGGILEKIKLLR
jgi:hypothetical protein